MEGVGLDSTCPRCGGDHGPPRVVGSGFADAVVSLTHASDFVAVVVGRGAGVGVDAEASERAPLSIAPRALTPHELARIDELEPSKQRSALTRYWVQKEAVLKATREGLAGGMKSVDTTDAAVAGVQRNGVHWRIDELDLRPGYACAVARPLNSVLRIA